MDDVFYRMTRLGSLEIGQVFMYKNTLFDKIYEKDSMVVGVTIGDFENNGNTGKQVMSFTDGQEVLIKVLNPIEHE